MIDRPKVLFRADGNGSIGLGHLIRSSALAGILKDKYSCALATRSKNEAVLEQVSPSFTKLIQLPEGDYLEEANFLASTYSDHLMVLDGYHYNETYQKILYNRNCSFFCIDDIHAYPFYAKAIINHSGGLKPTDYQALPGTLFYLGLRYALLRDDFLQAARNRNHKRDPGNCLICFGGADPGNKTLETLRNANLVNDKRFHQFEVVVGSAYKGLTELSEFCKGKKNIRVHQSLNMHEMIAVMKKCTYAICAPSTIVYEYMSVGGIVFLEQIADNQKDVIRYMTTEGLAFHLSDIGTVDELAMKQSLEKQALFFDGRSGDRFCKLFDRYFASQKLNLRKASGLDIEKCFEWINDPGVRLQSYSQEKISYEDHVRWFNQKLKDPFCYYYILVKDGGPVAQIRFQVNEGDAVISYLVDPNVRSEGMGTTVLSNGLEAFTGEFRKPVRIIGFVKGDNIASQRSFEHLAFDKQPSSEHPGSFKYIMHYGD